MAEALRVMTFASDKRVVLTLDAGGTNFRFSAMAGNRAVTETITLPSCGHDLDRCLGNLISGFQQTLERCPRSPVAISFAFPGPCDYRNGIIGDLGNLPGFRGGVPLGPMLQKRFGIPVFINNDGDLFAYGEAIAGFLPEVNGLLKQAGSPKRYQNLLGVTLGTGFGGGVVRNGELFLGDNSIGAELWLLRHKLERQMNVEEGASIRAVRRVYAERAGISFEQSPEPKEICLIAEGRRKGSKAAAREAFRRLGEVAGDAIAQAATLVDGLIVIGGGVSGAASLFLPALMAELNGSYVKPDGTKLPRLASRAFNLESTAERRKFLRGTVREVLIPGTKQNCQYDSEPRIAVGVSRLGTSRAVAIGAYAFALRALVENGTNRQRRRSNVR